METLDLAEAATFLRMNPEVLRRKAKQGLVPGKKCGKCWVFIKEHLANWISQPKITDVNKNSIIVDKELLRKKTCQSTKEIISGTLKSQPQMANEYSARLGLQ